MGSRSTASPSGLPPRADFSTRLAQNEGIPEYNALLDVNLGKRREFLLGNKQSLQLLQRTGAIARVEEHTDNPHQYVVYMNEKKHGASGIPKRRPTMSHILDDHSLNRSIVNRRASSATLKRSESTPHLSSSLYRTHRRPRDERDEDSMSSDDMDTTEQLQVKERAKPSHTDALLSTRRPPPLLNSLCRSATATALTSTSFRFGSSSALLRQRGPTDETSPSSLIERLRRRHASQDEANDLVEHHASIMETTPSFRPATRPATPSPAPNKSEDRSVVERLLASDAAYQFKLQVLRDEMRVLTTEKVFFDAQITTIRKRLRGVNAVHENDVAVAHCAAVMHARIAKVEVEYMKLVTAQQRVKTDIDALRRELLAMRKVTKKLEEDVADVEANNALLDEKIKALKSVRHALAHELAELEHRAELQEEKQRLKLPPEDDVVVDPHELMTAVQKRQQARKQSTMRRNSVVLTAGSPLANLQRMLSDSKASTTSVSSDAGKPLLNLCRAFRVIQQTLGVGEDLADFIAQFEATEDALLSKHSLNVQLQEEVDALEREAATLARDATLRHASMRGSQEQAVAVQHALHDQILKAQERTDAYLALKDVRNYEHTRLRTIMQRCLEILHAEKMINSSVLLSELSPPAMLEALQKRMTEVAITLKLQHHGKAGDDDAGSKAALKTRVGGASRRSNLLQKRETPASKIVMGPREPSGAAMTAIMITAQPPTIEGAQALSEAHAAEMHALHPGVFPATATMPGAMHKAKTTKLTIARAASIRAGKRVSVLTPNGSIRRISAPAAPNTNTEVEASNRKPTRASMVWPLKKNATRGSKQGSTDNLIHAEGAFARVIDDEEELDD